MSVKKCIFYRNCNIIDIKVTNIAIIANNEAIFGKYRISIIVMMRVLEHSKIE